MNITLTRQAYDDNGILGMMADDQGNMLCYTMEKPWCDNEPDTSCIPTGTYQVQAYSSPKFPDVWQVMNVPDRQYILIHNGNTDLDTHGCILVGDSIGVINGLPAVLDSVKTLERLKTILPDEFQLIIA